MADSWDDRKRVKEDEFFERQNRLAMEKLKQKSPQTPRLSPINGKPMEQVQIEGITIDRCPQSGYVGIEAETQKKLAETPPLERGELLGRIFEALLRNK